MARYPAWQETGWDEAQIFSRRSSGSLIRSSRILIPQCATRRHGPPSGRRRGSPHRPDAPGERYSRHGRGRLRQSARRRSGHPPASDVLRALGRRPASARGRGARCGAGPSARSRDRCRARRRGWRSRLCPAPRAPRQRAGSRGRATRRGRGASDGPAWLSGARARRPRHARTGAAAGGVATGPATSVSARLWDGRRRARPDDGGRCRGGSRFSSRMWRERFMR